MDNTLVILLWLIAAVLAAVGGFGNPPRVNLTSLALAFLAAGFVTQALA